MAETGEAAPAPRRRTRKKTAAADAGNGGSVSADAPGDEGGSGAAAPARPEAPSEAADDSAGRPSAPAAVAFQPPSVLFQPPAIESVPDEPAAKGAEPAESASAPAPTSGRRRRGRGADESDDAETGGPTGDTDSKSTQQDSDSDDDDGDGEDGGRRRRRRRGGRRRNKAGGDDDGSGDDSKAGSDTESGRDSGRESGKDTEQDADESESDDTHDEASADDDGGADDEESGGGSGSRRRRRRRRRRGESVDGAPDDPEATVVKVREPRKSDEVTSVEGSTRLEAKRQRRREGREAGRRRPPILSESEFLARRESVERTMVIRQHGDRTQIAVLEDDVLVEHYVTRETQSSMIGNVYLGRVQNVLPSMEAAFVDIGRGRNAVLYAGEVDWNGLGLEGQPKRIEAALKSGQTVLVQVTKDPVGHKGARLTSQVSIPGRYLVYVPHGSMNGISRKLPDTERNRLKQLLKEIVPDEAGVVVRTAAEGASEEELSRDVTRLQAQWESIDKKSKSAQAPNLLYAEPDLLIKVVRDLFTEDFTRLVVSGDEAWDMVEGYVGHVAPHLADRLERWTTPKDVFASFRVDEQIVKALDRKVWLPSGGSLIIERTEAMTVIDVNTGKFTGAGGNLEETVTKNNLEAAEEIVRQLRLRDIGGIIVVDFIDMVLESNRDLVLRRLVECLGRDRTKHQVAEVTSLGLVQMTRKRIGTGLIESFSEPCEACNGRGVHVHLEPVESGGEAQAPSEGDGGRRSRRRRRGGGGGGGDQTQEQEPESAQDESEIAQEEPESAEDQSESAQGEPESAPGESESAQEPDTATAVEVAAGTPESAASPDRAERAAAPEAATPETVPAETDSPAAEAAPVAPTAAAATPVEATSTWGQPAAVDQDEPSEAESVEPPKAEDADETPSVAEAIEPSYEPVGRSDDASPAEARGDQGGAEADDQSSASPEAEANGTDDASTDDVQSETEGDAAHGDSDRSTRRRGRRRAFAAE